MLKVPFQLLSPPPFFTKSVVPETELKAQVLESETFPELVKTFPAVKEQLLMFISPDVVVTTIPPFNVEFKQLKDVGLKLPLVVEDDCVKRFSTNDPFVNPLVRIAPED